MGEPGQGRERRTFFGVSNEHERESGKAQRGAEQCGCSKRSRQTSSGPEKTAWFDITSMEVELANQHPKTFKVGVTPK